MRTSAIIRALGRYLLEGLNLLGRTHLIFGTPVEWMIPGPPAGDGPGGVPGRPDRPVPGPNGDATASDRH